MEKIYSNKLFKLLEQNRVKRGEKCSHYSMGTPVGCYYIYGMKRDRLNKLISKTILCLLTKKKIPIHGKGDNYRHYLSVHDFCNGVVKIIKNGKFKEIYNISSDKSYKVKDIIKIIAKNLNKDFKSNIKFIKDRPFNDKIYKINCSKLKKLNWKVERNLTDDISTICDWYKSNINLFIK